MFPESNLKSVGTGAYALLPVLGLYVHVLEVLGVVSNMKNVIRLSSKLHQPGRLLETTREVTGDHC